MRLEMNSQMAYIGIQTKNAQVSIEQPSAELDIKTTHAKVNIETTLPKVRIDNSRPRAESGLKGNRELTQDMVQRAFADMQAGKARAAEQGNRLADIHKSKNVIAEVADDNAWGQFQKEFGMVTMPRSKPDIQVIEGQNNIQVQEGKVEIKATPRKPIIDYQRGKVDIYLRQRNALEIKVVPDKFDMKV